MFACVIYNSKVKKIIPTSWIYESKENIVLKKHYLAFFNEDLKKIAPPSQVLAHSECNKLENNKVHKIFLYKLLGKFHINRFMIDEYM